MKRYALLLALIFLLCGLPWAFAAEDGPFQEGDRVVIWLPEKGMALSSRESRKQRAAVAVTMTEGELTGFSDTEIWTAAQTEDGWRFCQNGQVLSLTGSENALILDGERDSWILERDEDLYRLKNAKRARYLSYHTSYQYWTIATSGAKIAFYVLPREEEPTQPPETIPPTEPPTPEYGGKYLYFGQLHAHTDLSDGTGTVEEAFAYASRVPGLDFFAVTDHSQNFDGGETASLTTDARAYSQDWARGKAAGLAVTADGFVGIFGFEMTWNQGQGHMSTFATPGFLSRDQDDFASYATGLEHYYDALLEAETSVSQFNHPGGTDGDFKGFSDWSPELDQRITLIEVGEDTSWYDRALEAGWHLAPTNNQNNHAGQWGDATTARTVVLAAELTEQAIYDALANCRAYATYDSDLQIYFTANTYEMGSEIPKTAIGETITLSAQLYDPTDRELGTLEVVTEAGRILAKTSLSGAKGQVQFTLPADRDYYYLRVTQPDGDWAVTAPIWLDEQTDYGIAAIQTATPVTTAGESQRILLELYNHEKMPLTITSVTLTVEGTQLTDDSVTEVAPFGRTVCGFPHTFEKDGVYMVTGTVTALDQGRERRFTQSQPITVMPPALVDTVRVDGTHGNGESLERAISLAKGQDVAMLVETEAITAQTLADCRCLIIPSPQIPFEVEFVDLVADFAAGGGTVILCGTSAEENPDAAARLNGLLEAMGSNLRLHADEARDDVHNGGEPNQLYTMNFGQSPWLEGITEGQRYHQDAGGTVIGGTALIRGQHSAYSTIGAEVVLLAAEETTAGGWIFLSGGLFLSDAHIRETKDTWTLPKANQTILESILRLGHSPQRVIPIQDLRNAEAERIYLAEGRVTAGTANPHNTFENTIYIQDATGGIAAVPYSRHGLALGTRVRVLGMLRSDGENPQLEILRLEVLVQEDVQEPQAVSCDLSDSQLGGQLLQIRGRVVSRELMTDGIGISHFVLQDEAGNRAAVLVDDNIRSGSRGKNELSRQIVPGNLVSAVGIWHVSQGEPVLRLRDCDEVHLLDCPAWEIPIPEEDEEDPTIGEDTDPDNTTPDGDNPDGTNPDGGDTENPDGGNGGNSGENPGDDPGDNPNTGQQEGILYYAALMLLSALAMAGLQTKNRPG